MKERREATRGGRNRQAQQKGNKRGGNGGRREEGTAGRPEGRGMKMGSKRETAGKQEDRRERK
jgi:hypothetical protein